MKRLFALLGAVCVLLSANPWFAAFAAETDDAEASAPGGVTITVVMPEPTEEAEPKQEVSIQDSSTFIKLYPSDVTETIENGERVIVKTYALRPDEDPADIPREDFERGGWRFELTDILRRETANAETREHTEKISLNTDTKELEKILPLLSPTMEYKADDGFVGVLSLDVASILVETAGTKTSSYTMSVTREYPRLSSNDTSLIPKTVEEQGKTYTLAGVDWRAENTETVDYDALPEYYTAYAMYTATGTSTKATGYVTTAEYNGTLARLTQGETIYTAYFEGEEIITPLEFAEPSSDKTFPDDLSGETVDQTAAGLTANPVPTETPNPTATPPTADNSERGGSNTAPYVIIAILLIFLAGATYIIIRRNPRNEKIDYPASDASADADGGSSGDGRRL